MALDAKSLIGELKRRKVFRVTGIYLVAAWGVSTGAAELLPAFGAPDWTVPTLTIVVFLGLPIAIVLAWTYELTPEGVVRDDLPDNAALPEMPEPPPPTIALSPSGARAQVRWTASGEDHERSFNAEFMIGREANCDVCLDNVAVSRRHAKVSYVGDSWVIEDLGSQNGTFVDGVRISKHTLTGLTDVGLSDDGPSVQIELRESAAD